MAESDTPKRDEPSSTEKNEDALDPEANAEVSATADAGAAAEARPAAKTADDAGGAPAPDHAREHAKGPSWLPITIAIALPLLFFFVLPPLTRAGLWDPHELNVADLARRIALNLHGAGDLALEGADNSLPHLNDLGRPQLPFTSIALGFKTFGLHEWAGRGPLALWGLVGVLATYGWVSRLVDRRAGLFAAVALTTMPLFFVQARTMLGDIVMMSAFAMAFGGLLVAVFDRGDEGEPNLGARAFWSLVAVVGLAAGYFTRGALIGVATPTLAVALAYGLSLANAGPGRRPLDTVAHAAGVLAGILGLYFAYRGITALGGPRTPDLNPWIGAMIRPPTKYPTFDFTIGHIAEGLAPWSAFAPFAFGRLFMSPKTHSTDAHARESATRMALLIATGLAFVAHGWMAARTDLVAFAAPSIIAAACGVALRDYERGAHPSVAMGVGTAVFLATFHHEIHNLPEKAFNAFAVVGAVFPESFKPHSYLIWTIVLVGFAAIAFLTFVERDAERVPFAPVNYLKVLIALRDAWDGMLALAFFALVAGASLAGLAVWIGTRAHARWLPTLSSQMRDGVLNAWWATAFIPLAVIFGMFFWCDVWLWAFGRARPLTKSSATRGFEPFETLGGELKNAGLGTSMKDLVVGKLVVTLTNTKDGIGPTALIILAPLMYLQVPLLVFLGLYFGAGMRPLVAGAFALPAGVAVFLFMGFAGDLLRGSRAAFLVVFAGTVGAILCFSYYPALANQLSPKEVFESYQKVKSGNEPLALFGVGGRTAAYYAGGQPMILKDANGAYDWLMGGESGSRRFLAVRAEELPRLNRLYRERTGTGKNLPVLDARSSQIILVASALRGDEKNENPLDKVVFTAPPQVQKKLEANLEDKLEVIGYDIVDTTGKLVDHVAPGKKYHMRTYFKVLAPVASEWEMFIHIDGFHRRHNGDHKMAEGKYPMSLWLPGDIVMDDHEFTLEPNFSPGPYTLYFGLFVGETRLKVKSGPTDGENRVNGGALRVQ
jgi:Dolichyl-phosphate-mannose-protein mannosyltransferase